MLTSGRGREYAKVIPEKSILLETDLPSRKGEACSVQSMKNALQDALETIEHARNRPMQDMIFSNTIRILEP